MTVQFGSSLRSDVQSPEIRYRHISDQNRVEYLDVVSAYRVQSPRTRV